VSWRQHHEWVRRPQLTCRRGTTGLGSALAAQLFGVASVIVLLEPSPEKAEWKNLNMTFVSVMLRRTRRRICSLD